MNQPWSAEHAVEEPLARGLIEAQFPRLTPVRIKLLGAGWDNTAFLVNDALVFRFPRRQMALALLEAERQLLPQIASRLPLPVPIPEFCGQAGDGYPWPFAGYRFLPGRTASAAALDDSQRLGTAEPIARFLRALHSLPADEMARAGAGPDALGRLDVSRRAARARQRLEALSRLGLVASPKRVIELLEAAGDPRLPGPKALVHGDLYAAHLLVDAQGQPCGVIDWGDVHLGHPALDLSFVFGFLPPQGHRLFEQVYGHIDEETCWLARFKALEMAITLVAYGRDIGKADLVQEGQKALEYAAGKGTGAE